MLPPHELKNKTFTRAMRGYNPVEVDEYIEFLIEKYTELYRENDELERKLKSAVTKLDEIKNDEDSIRSALIEAKRAASQIKAEAEERAEAIIRSAKVSCNTILSDFNEKIENGRSILIALKSNTVELKRELFDRYSDHIKYIDKITENIDTSDIPDSDTLRRKAVTSLKSNIAEIYAASDTTKYSSTPEPKAEEAEPEDIEPEAVEPEDTEADDAVTTEFNSVQSETEDMEETIEFTPASAGSDYADESETAEADGSDSYAPTAMFDEILGKPASENISDDEPALIVNREPLTTKPAKSGLKNSIRDLNQRYKESQDIINTPDSDLEDDANYLDFVKSVTGKDKNAEPAKEADFDLLFNESKNKKKK